MASKFVEENILNAGDKIYAIKIPVINSSILKISAYLEFLRSIQIWAFLIALIAEMERGNSLLTKSFRSLLRRLLIRFLTEA